jgi:predicted O-linked N-acetylglucosamine transferase (SPINDLY family)
VGVSLLTCVGVPDLIASEEEAYVRVAVGLANDPAARRRLRASLRPAMAGSPLCDGPGYARRLEGVLRDLWRDFCRG